jgi:hypothetical protein
VGGTGKCCVNFRSGASSVFFISSSCLFFFLQMGETGKLGANVFNDESRTTDKGWSSSSGMGRRAKKRHGKILACYIMSHRALDLAVALGCCEHVNELRIS